MLYVCQLVLVFSESDGLVSAQWQRLLISKELETSCEYVKSDLETA